MQLTPEMLDAIYEETQGIVVLAVVLYVLIQEDAISSERETFDVKDIHRISKERMTLVQPMLEALRKNDQKEIDRYEDITDILVEEVSARFAGYRGVGPTENARLSGSAALTKLRNEIIPFFIKLKKSPEMVDKLIEQVYRETKSTDISEVLALVYDRLRKQEASTETLLAEGKVAAKNDFKEIAGQIDSTAW